MRPPDPRAPPAAIGMTLEEIAMALGVSRERVRQIEERALRRCRQWCERHGYELADLLDTGRPSERTRFRDLK